MQTAPWLPQTSVGGHLEDQFPLKGTPVRCHVRGREGKWVWLKIEQEGIRRLWSMFPLTRATHFGTCFLSHSQMLQAMKKRHRQRLFSLVHLQIHQARIYACRFRPCLGLMLKETWVCVKFWDPPTGRVLCWFPLQTIQTDPRGCSKRKPQDEFGFLLVSV